MIRRVEGIQRGIPLHESAKLIPLNSEISQLVHDPHGRIHGILASEGYDLQSKTIDQICEKMSPAEILKITQKYIDIQTIPTPSSATESYIQEAIPASKSDKVPSKSYGIEALLV